LGELKVVLFKKTIFELNLEGIEIHLIVLGVHEGFSFMQSKCIHCCQEIIEKVCMVRTGGIVGEGQRGVAGEE
jgi:hypothetical protein